MKQKNLSRKLIHRKKRPGLMFQLWGMMMGLVVLNRSLHVVCSGLFLRTYLCGDSSVQLLKTVAAGYERPDKPGPDGR